VGSGGGLGTFYTSNVSENYLILLIMDRLGPIGPCTNLHYHVFVLLKIVFLEV